MAGDLMPFRDESRRILAVGCALQALSADMMYDSAESVIFLARIACASAVLARRRVIGRDIA